MGCRPGEGIRGLQECCEVHRMGREGRRKRTGWGQTGRETSEAAIEIQGAFRIGEKTKQMTKTKTGLVG